VPEPSRAPATLILVPTEGEERRLAELGGFAPELGARARCGFGPVAAAARAAQLVAELRPRRVLLVGIAGGYAPERAPVGSALVFARVDIEGVGAGQGPGIPGPGLGPARLRFAQWDGPPGEAVHDSLPLLGPAGSLLLTVCAASGTPSEAEARRRRHPEALAEDMEGFGVALACRLLEVPLVVVRGISNRAGERDHEKWRVRDALAAARALALEWLQRDDWGRPAARPAGP
jgi:futalosine hydrolase